jgi:hypothetical protein
LSIGTKKEKPKQVYQVCFGFSKGGVHNMEEPNTIITLDSVIL